MDKASELRSTLAAATQWVVIHRWDFVYRIAVAVLLLAWLRVFPLYLLTIYAGARGIPPFELAGEDFGGVHVLLTWTLVFLAMGALYLWSPLILAILRRLYISDPLRALPGGVQPSRVELVLSSASLRNFSHFLASVLVAAMLAIGIGSGRMPWRSLLHFSLASLVLALSIFLFVRRDRVSAIVNWQGPLAFVFISLFLPIAFVDATVSILNSTLRQYRVGGLLSVSVTRFDSHSGGSETVTGRLLLLGTHRVYLEQGEGAERKLLVIVNGEDIRVNVGKWEPIPEDR